jgi:hypothetical protein
MKSICYIARMASRNHRIILNHLHANSDAAVTTTELMALVYPEVDVTDPTARASLSRTIRRMKLPKGWEVREPKNQRLPYVLFNSSSAESLAAADRLSGA